MSDVQYRVYDTDDLVASHNNENDALAANLFTREGHIDAVQEDGQRSQVAFRASAELAPGSMTDWGWDNGKPWPNGRVYPLESVDENGVSRTVYWWQRTQQDAPIQWDTLVIKPIDFPEQDAYVFQRYPYEHWSAGSPYRLTWFYKSGNPPTEEQY